MNRTRSLWPLLTALLGAALITVPARADEPPADLKQKILKFNSITGTEAIFQQTRDLVKDPAETKKLLKVAEEMAKADPKQFKYTGALILARTAGALKNYDLSLRFFKICSNFATTVKSSTKLGESYGGQVGILSIMKKYAEAEKVAQAFMELEGDEELEKEKIGMLLDYLIPAKAHQGKIAEALKMVDRLTTEFKGEWSIVQLKALVLFEAGKYDEAVKTYGEVIELLNKSDRMKPAEQEARINRVHYILSSVYVEMGQIDKAAGELQLLLKKKPNDPTYNNDLGYIWCDHDMNLDESEKLIRKAIEEDRKERKSDKDLSKEDDRDKAAYLDSLGWVLFKKKQYAEAKKPLLDAVKDPDDGQHIEIYDHLADVHMALGEKAEAIAVWKKALDMDIEGKRDQKRQQEMLKKLKAAQGK